MSPVFAHGQLRLYLLALLADGGPRHGYEIIQDLERRFNGLYTPSAGTVYPRLAKLEEEGLVARDDEGRKAVYRITDAGRAEVEARRDDLADLETDLDMSVRELADEVRARVRAETQDLRAQLKEAAREARRSARPAGGRTDSWSGSSETLRDLERTVQQIRRDVRDAWRQSGISSEQTREVADILSDASSRIREVFRRR